MTGRYSTVCPGETCMSGIRFSSSSNATLASILASGLPKHNGVRDLKSQVLIAVGAMDVHFVELGKWLSSTRLPINRSHTSDPSGIMAPPNSTSLVVMRNRPGEVPRNRSVSSTTLESKAGFAPHFSVLLGVLSHLDEHETHKVSSSVVTGRNQLVNLSYDTSVLRHGLIARRILHLENLAL